MSKARSMGRCAVGLGSVLALSMGLALFLAGGCSDDKSVDHSGGNGPEGRMVSHSECKGHGLESAGEEAISGDCIEWVYDGEGTLSMLHVNAAFNCCVASFACKVDVGAKVITIQEKEVLDDGCHCLCLYDLDYEVTDLPVGEYTIEVLEPYFQEGDDTLRFTVDLSSEPSGNHCEYRDHYPWNINAQPQGSLVGHTGCKDQALAPSGGSDTPDTELDCIDYEYDASGILLLKHRNAHLNCCTLPTAVITVKANVITITEADSVGMPLCDCTCPFDIDYQITNVRPEEYQIKVVEPYRCTCKKPLEFTVDFLAAPIGSHCEGL